MGWPRGQQQHLEQQLGAVRGTEVKIATSWGKCPYPICTNDLPALQGKSLTPGQTALVQSSFFQGHLQLSVAYPGSNLPLPLGSPSSHQTRPEGIISPLPTGANQSQVYFLSLQLFGLIYPTTWALQGLFLFWQLQLRLHPLPRTTTADPSLALGAPQICIPTRHPVSLPHLWIHPCPLHFLLRYISRTPLTQFPTFHTGLLYPVSTLMHLKVSPFSLHSLAHHLDFMCASAGHSAPEPCYFLRCPQGSLYPQPYTQATDTFTSLCTLRGLLPVTCTQPSGVPFPNYVSQRLRPPFCVQLTSLMLQP